jgi:hypothetical protein
MTPDKKPKNKTKPQMQTLKVSLTTIEPMLGSSSANPDLHKEFIAGKAPDADKAEEELRALPVELQLEKAMTVFPRDDKGLFLWDYQVKGFIKEAIGIACETGNTLAGPLTKWTYKRAVDSLIFIEPRRIYMTIMDEPLKESPDQLTRPLRCDTMQGSRVALATSEQVPTGVNLEFTISWLECDNAKSKLKITEDLLRWALNYGKLKGLGQWRSGGFGRFEWEEDAAA